MRRIKLSGVGTLLFVAAALAAFPANVNEEIYAARVEDVPAWAEQGNFRFIRIDGGRIESMKAERTWWGRNFSSEEKDLLARVYDQDFDRMLALLQEARFNWIWVTWSNGWSTKEESDNREQIEKVIALCHQNNIRVTAYMSATNMFWKSAYRDDPETIKYGLFMYGLPIFYTGLPKTGPQVNFARRLADVRFPGWRAYLVNKAALAVDAGVDAIFYDNIIGDNDGMKLLLSETQRMAAAKAEENGRPKIMVYANVHIGPARFDINDGGEVIWEEAGKDTPGVWDGEWQVDNVRRIKFLSAEKQPWQPLMYENDVYHCGARERCIPSPIEQKLAIAEAYSFGAALSRNIEGRFLASLLTGKKEALDAWAAIAQYNGFVAEHVDFYHGITSAAKIALLSDDEKNPVADLFIKQNVIFETKVWRRLGQGDPLRGFKVLVIPFRIRTMDERQRLLLKEFVAGSGTVICPDPERLAKMLGLETGTRVSLVAPANDFIAQVRKAAGGPRITLANNRYLLASVTRKPDNSVFIVHLINYDHAAENLDVKITLDLQDYVPDLSGFEVKAFSPDEEAPDLSNVLMQGGAVELTIDAVSHYMVVVISARPL